MSPPTARPEVHVRTRAELLAVGRTDADIGRDLSAGRIIKLGRGTYGTAQTPPQVAAAIARGHRLTCLDALDLMGVWTPPHEGRHESALRAGRRAGSAAQLHGIVLHDPPLRRWPDSHPVLPTDLALGHAARCLDPENLAIVLESALNRRLIDAADARDVLSAISRRQRSAVLPLRDDAESGTETRVRRALTRRGIRVMPQARIPGVGRVDLLVGEKLIIECDSHAFHASPQQITEDRRRDLVARDLGYTVLRLSYHQVMVDWGSTLAMILEVVRRGEHRTRRSTARRAEGALRGRARSAGRRDQLQRPRRASRVR